MNIPKARYTKLLITCWLIASLLATLACSHRHGPEGISGSRAGVHPFTDKDINDFTGSIRYKQGDAGDHYRLGRYFQDRGKHRLALNEFSRAIDFDPFRADAHNAMGVSFDKSLKFDLAEQCYRRALLFKPDFAAAYNNLGYSYILRGKPEKAIAPLQKAVDLQSRNIRFHNNLALAYKQTGQIAQAAVEVRLTGQEIQVNGKVAGPHAPASAGLVENDLQTRNTDKDDHLSVLLPALRIPGTDPLPDQSPDSSPPNENGSENSKSVIARTPGESLRLTPQIDISNGNGVHKMASHIATYLKHKGFDIHRLSNADHFEYPQTRIYYSDGQRRTACNLSRLLFGPDVECDLINSGRKYGRVRILVGEDVAGLNDLFNGRLKIQVTNGNGVKAAAQRLSSYLRTKGFYVVPPTNAGHFEYPFTQVFYPTGQLANAQFLAREFPENCSSRLVMAEPGTTTIRIIIGKDFVTEKEKT